MQFQQLELWWKNFLILWDKSTYNLQAGPKVWVLSSGVIHQLKLILQKQRERRLSTSFQWQVEKYSISQSLIINFDQKPLNLEPGRKKYVQKRSTRWAINNWYISYYINWWVSAHATNLWRKTKPKFTEISLSWNFFT